MYAATQKMSYNLEMPKQAGEFRPVPLAPQPVLRSPLTALLEWQALAEGAYSPNTLRAQKADGAIFRAFCESRGEPYLPADPMTIRAFIEDRVKAGKKPATIKRYVATIARVHVAAKLLNPCSSEAVRLGLKKIGRETSARQSRAHPLGWKEIWLQSPRLADGNRRECRCNMLKGSMLQDQEWHGRRRSREGIRLLNECVG
jgi:hypothetical protein